MEWKQSSEKDGATVIPSNWIYIHYYEALNTLFRVENSLRVFVYVVLKNIFFDKWCHIQITSDDAEEATIETIARKRRNQAQDFGYLGYSVDSAMMYLTGGELIRIITSDAYWKHFKPYFPASKNIVEHKLDEIGVIRNSLAHFRPLKSEDVEVIKNNAKHVLSEVEYFLEQLGSCFSRVPTNTSDDWYLSIVPLRNECCDLTLYQSEDQTWIELNFAYRSKVLSTVDYARKGEFYSHQILNLLTPQILRHYVNITRYATCLTEMTASATNYDPKNPSFHKSFYIYFKRDVLAKYYQEIANDIQGFLDRIKSETELILSDNLARGQLISVSRVSAKLHQSETSKQWNIQSADTLCPYSKQNSFTEYWANTILFSSLFTSSDEYPWMPTQVSKFG